MGKLDTWTLRILGDGSILAGGPNAANFVYNVTVATLLNGITGFRLEVLADPGFPDMGPGRATNGNFTVTEFEVISVNLGDVNLDGVVNLLDVSLFVNVLTSSGFQCEADINLDGAVDLLDVSLFVDLLTNQTGRKLDYTRHKYSTTGRIRF